jgi:FixJ family two-component response regulator
MASLRCLRRANARMLREVAVGRVNKQIAFDLGIARSP